MSSQDPQEQQDVDCPECGGVAEQSGRHSLRCAECGWTFEDLPDNDPEPSFWEENNIP
jgi:DNA-directed RNA polymerase subunit RPC12/RpoP